MYIRNRSIPMIIILSIVTCGIYYLIWLYQTESELNNTLGDTKDSPGLELLLVIVTCGLYSIYWFYKYCKKTAELSERMQVLPADDNSLPCLLLCIFGFGVISMAILQYQINRLADRMPPSAPNNGTQQNYQQYPQQLPPQQPQQPQDQPQQPQDGTEE